MVKPTWTDAQLAAAVAANTTLRGVVHALGLSYGSYDTLRRHIARLGLDASHIRAVEGSTRRRPRSWSDDELLAVVRESTTYSQVMRRLGYVPSGGIHRWLKALIREHGISTEHFVGSTLSSGALRRRLIKEGLLGQPTARTVDCRSGGVSHSRSRSTTSTGIRWTTGSRTSVSSVPTATR